MPPMDWQLHFVTISKMEIQLAMGKNTEAGKLFYLKIRED
jgi:hypothetical protein